MFEQEHYEKTKTPSNIVVKPQSKTKPIIVLLLIILIATFGIGVFQSFQGAEIVEVEKVIYVSITSTPETKMSATSVTPVVTAIIVPTEFKLCGDVNIRDNPSEKGISYGNLLVGDIVLVYEIKNGWAKISVKPERWVFDLFCR